MSKVVDLSKFVGCLGRFIARYDDRLIECADTVEELIDNLKDRNIDPRFVIIDYVPKEPIHYVLYNDILR